MASSRHFTPMIAAGMAKQPPADDSRGESCSERLRVKEYQGLKIGEALVMLFMPSRLEAPSS